MSENQNIIDELEKIIHWKQSKKFYSEKLHVSEEEIGRMLKHLYHKTSDGWKKEEITKDDIVFKFFEDIVKGEAEVVFNSPNEIKTLNELIEKCKIDTDKWEITKYIQNYWGNDNRPQWQVKAWLSLKKEDLQFQKTILLKELRESLPIKSLISPPTHGKKLAYEISIPDVHFGKMSWEEEVGENYNLKIAEQRYRNAISELLSYVNINDIEKIIFPIGNDMLNIDSRRNETFAGTRMDSDSRFFKIVKTVKSILIDVINSLSQIAPVDVIVISGNHDPESMFMLGEILESYYHNTECVKVDNSPKQRKYYSYGKNGFQYTHGNEEKHNDLGLIFATEEPKLWAATEFRFCKLGHFHKNKKIEYISVEDHTGFQIQILPSLSGADFWHNSKGYVSNKQAKGFLYDKNRGQIGEFTYSI